MNKNKLIRLIIAILVILLGGGKTYMDQQASNSKSQSESSPKIEVNQEDKKTMEQGSSEILEDQFYYDRDEIAVYIHTYGHLPANYISKSEAEQINWSTKDEVYVVGGNKFGNREGLLPKKSGRQYYEADIQAGYTNHRGPQRIIYSNDGLIFYTDDHYESFQQLY